MKFSIFTAEKNLCMLHEQRFVMLLLKTPHILRKGPLTIWLINNIHVRSCIIINIHVRSEEFFFSSSEFRVTKASFELEKWVSSQKSEFRVKKVSFEFKKWVSS